jgi:hypothetical protein
MDRGLGYDCLLNLQQLVKSRGLCEQLRDTLWNQSCLRAYAEANEP